MQPEFLYFDLGKVLVDFDHAQMYRQIGEVSGVPLQRVEEVLQDGLQKQYETGQISGQKFYETFCQQTGAKVDYDTILRAGNEIFELNLSIVPLIAHLGHAGYRLGILSNTCESHWEYCARRFRMLAESFQVHALSFEIGVAKPEAAIFHTAAKLAGVQPGGIFYVDDLPEHVAAAKTIGIDAVVYTSTAQLASDLRSRGVGFNY
jgi:FMN phosphatase YigB (HAD superfamily)